ncbi:hypothetical protein K525DRAFT_185352, partial [Schizophyllum commune Loenen D]
VLDMMRQEDVSIADLMLRIIKSSSPVCRGHQIAFFKPANRAIPRILDAVYSTSPGEEQIEAWIDGRSIHTSMTCRNLAAEVKETKHLMSMTSREVSLEYLASWDLRGIVDPVLTRAPTLSSVLDRLLEKDYEVEEAAAQALLTVSPFPLFFKYLIVAMLYHAHTNNASKVQHALGLFVWSTGASRHLIEVLARAHLTPSFSTIQSTLSDLASDAVLRAIRAVDTVPHAFTYDNFKLSYSQFIEQRIESPSKVQSGSFCVFYELYRARFEHMKIAPMMDRLLKSTDLVLDDIITPRASACAFAEQATVHILRTLATYSKEFAYLYECTEMLTHNPRRPLPTSLRTNYYPIRPTTIEEATVEGNIRLQDDAGALLRADDVNAWHRRDVIQLAMGLFHVIMNLIWAIRHTHYGASEHQPGCLNYFFTVMEKARLGNEKPDYHSLLAALTQIFDGLVLDAWRRECGFPSLQAFSESEPTLQTIHEIASRILKNYASPSRPRIHDTSDTVNENTRLLLRDLLYVMELVQAVRDGDFGRVEDIYPDLARIFRGAGCNNYASEILHWIHNVKKVWTPEFA